MIFAFLCLEANEVINEMDLYQARNIVKRVYYYIQKLFTRNATEENREFEMWFYEQMKEDN